MDYLTRLWRTLSTAGRGAALGLCFSSSVWTLAPVSATAPFWEGKAPARCHPAGRTRSSDRTSVLHLCKFLRVNDERLVTAASVTHEHAEGHGQHHCSTPEREFQRTAVPQGKRGRRIEA